jgi:predicted peroxiredoxin
MTALLYVLTRSTDDPDRAVTGLNAAVAAVRGGHDVALWLTGEGVRLGIEGVAETLNESVPESAAEMLAALVQGGAVLCLDRYSFERREYQEDAVREGAAVADAERLAELLASGHRAVTL